MNKKKILIVDDTKINLDLLIELLKDDYLVLPALNGKNALSILDKKDIDLILLDIMMPQMSGFEVCEIIKLNNKLKNIPIIFITAKSDENSMEKAYDIGGSDYVMKPFKPKELLAKVKKELQIVELVNNLENKVKQEVEKNKKQQLLMLHQSRLAQMGEMISMIAHQWRQPLNSLSMLNQSIILKYTRDTLDKKFLEYFKQNTKKQISNMSQTIDDFRDFFKPEKEKIEFCINDVISDTIDMIKPIFILNKIDILFDKEETLKTLGYPNELGQAILNIINNAKDTLLENEILDKQITIELKQNKVSLENNTNITLTISDNAGGIPENIIDKIFDPYFSTKDGKNGTGLGLYMTKIIIEDHMKGKLSVSNSEKGAMFIIKFI